MAKLIIAGQVPPPFYGQSIMIKTMIDGLSELDYVHVPFRFSREVNEHGRFAVGKLFHTVGIIIALARQLIRHRGSVLYYPAPPPKWSTILRDLIILSICRPLAGRIVFHFHAYGMGEFLENRPWLFKLARALRKPDVAVILGQLCRKDATVIAARKTYEIPYGIDVRVVENGNQCSKQKVRILFVGLHIPSKGIGDVLETARLLKKRGVEFEIHMVGPWRNAQIEEDMVARRKESDLENLVLFKGELVEDELWKEYSEADILFFPTFYEFETFGVVVLEAMAYGMPVVASTWRGPGDLIEDGVTGLLCKCRDVEAYADALSSLIHDGLMRETMGQNARKQYEDRYCAKEYAMAMQEVFETFNVDRLDG